VRRPDRRRNAHPPAAALRRLGAPANLAGGAGSYYTMSLLDTVSQSVANTVKRTCLIFLSIWYFGNAITLFNVGGIMLVCIGVFAYNHARVQYPPPPMYNQRARPKEEADDREVDSPRTLHGQWADDSPRRPGEGNV
jgi:hypothetical protein